MTPRVVVWAPGVLAIMTSKMTPDEQRACDDAVLAFSEGRGHHVARGAVSGLRQLTVGRFRIFIVLEPDGRIAVQAILEVTE